MKRCIGIVVLLLWTVGSMFSVAAEGVYNDEQLNWGDLACQHTQVLAIDAVASTCLTAGHTAYTICADCRVYVGPAKEVLPLAEHTYDNDYDGMCNACGTHRPVSILPGDANLDGTIDNHDLALMQMYINEHPVEADVEAMDVNDDGRINNRDLGLLQRYLCGWDVELV